jgi:hypothetical protein
MSVDPPTNKPVAKNLQIVEKLSADFASVGSNIVRGDDGRVRAALKSPPLDIPFERVGIVQ